MGIEFFIFGSRSKGGNRFCWGGDGRRVALGLMQRRWMESAVRRLATGDGAGGLVSPLVGDWRGVGLVG
jgi:hypothetical protein